MKAYLCSPPNRAALLLIFSLSSIVVLLVRALVLAIQGLAGLVQATLSPADLGPYLLDATGMVFCALLLVPMLVGALRMRRGLGSSDARISPVKPIQFALLAIVWLAVLAAAGLLTGLFDFGWLLAAPAYLLGIFLPIAALLWLALGGLPAGSWRRVWSAFGLGLTGSTALAMAGEYSLLGLAVLLAAIGLRLNPEWRPIISQLQERLGNITDMQSLMDTLTPYLKNPWVLAAVLVFASGLGPLIEEAVKPLAVWILGRRIESVAQGFALGALGGAGFALMEGLLAASGFSSSLALGLPARSTSTLMHIGLSALMGWAIASARMEKRYRRLVGIYLLCAAIHGLWNASALVAVFASLQVSASGAETLSGSLLLVAGLAMLVLVMAAVAVLLISGNLRLRRALALAAPAHDIIPPLEKGVPDSLPQEEDHALDPDRD